MGTSKILLVIGKVWPEPGSSAAGSRMIQLLESFNSEGWDIVFASAAATGKYSADLTGMGIQEQPVKINDSGFDEFVKKLNPSIVLFDRFMTEEKFGWRVAENCPNAVRILDTEDLHCLRKTREQVFKEGRSWQKEDLLKAEISKREIASIYRCDLSLMISEAEIEILKEIFRVNERQLQYVPFLLQPVDKQHIDTLPSFKVREHFVVIGNFLHEPNWDAVQFLKNEIWPMIRKELQDAELHIYGSYVTKKAEQLHNSKEGFLVKGRAENAANVVAGAKVCLAPLRFGAGLKGKLAEAMMCGTPSVTTKIGAEGLAGKHNWNGAIANNPAEFARESVRLYTDKTRWSKAQKNGFTIINSRFQSSDHISPMMESISCIVSELEDHRTKNFIGSMLMHHTSASSRYMSKWIEEKNRRENQSK